MANCYHDGVTIKVLQNELVFYFDIPDLGGTLHEHGLKTAGHPGSAFCEISARMEVPSGGGRIAYRRARCRFSSVGVAEGLMGSSCFCPLCIGSASFSGYAPTKGSASLPSAPGSGNPRIKLSAPIERKTCAPSHERSRSIRAAKALSGFGIRGLLDAIPSSIIARC